MAIGYHKILVEAAAAVRQAKGFSNAATASEKIANKKLHATTTISQGLHRLATMMVRACPMRDIEDHAAVNTFRRVCMRSGTPFWPLSLHIMRRGAGQRATQRPQC